VSKAKIIRGARAKFFIDGKEIGLWSKPCSEVVLGPSYPVQPFTLELFRATWKREMERCEPDPPIIVSPQVYAAYTAMFPPATGAVIPSSYTSRCSKCNAMANTCRCYDVEETPVDPGPPSVAVPEAPKPEHIVKFEIKLSKSREERAKDMLNLATADKGRCYICWNPDRTTAAHRVTGIRFCIPCAVQHLVQET
jgi:hypothetical protein